MFLFLDRTVVNGDKVVKIVFLKHLNLSPEPRSRRQVDSPYSVDSVPRDTPVGA